MAWKCPSCGHINPSNDIVRCVCGHEPEDSLREKARVALCPSCIEYNNLDSDHCDNCGFNLKLYRTDPNNALASLKIQKPDVPGTARELPLEFSGSAREYFRIWIVNLCLTLITCGIFSAWAKVRKKRYFYSNVSLDGTPFQYLGQPIPVLKGRLIAAAAFSVYYVSSHLFTSLLPYVFAAGLIVAPWVVVRSAAFNARYSAFRNMTFCFDGKYLDALKVICSWGIIPAFVIGSMFNWWGFNAGAGILVAAAGLAFPWWIRRLKNFLIGNTGFGGKKGEFSATGGQFFRVYFTAGLITIAVGTAAAVVVAVMSKVAAAASSYSFLFFVLPFYASYVLAYAYVQAHSNNLIWNQTRLGSLSFRSTMRGREMALLYLTNAVAIIASLGLMIPWAVMRTLKYRADHTMVMLDGELADFRGVGSSAVAATGAEMGEFFDMDLSL